MSTLVSRQTFAAVALTIASTLPSVAQSLVVNNGDLLMGFYEISESGTSVSQDTYVLNLGQASVWRETETVPTLVTNIKTDLDATFPGWAENSRLRMAVVGTVIDTTASPLSGDPARTVYFSRGATTFTDNATETFSLSTNQMGAVSTQIKGFSGAMNGQASASNPNGAIVSTSENLNFSSFLPPASTTHFGISINPFAAFGTGTIGSTDTYQVEAAVDVYRLLFSTTGADLTAGQTPGDAVARTGQYIGTFTIDSAGNVRIDAPEPVAGTLYDQWLDSYSLTGTDRDAAGDPDHDGIANVVEFVIGGNPKTQDDSSWLPTVVSGANYLELTFRRSNASEYLNPVVEYSTTLASPWTPAVNGTAGVTITEAVLDADTDMVTVRIPVSGQNLFARLSVSIQ